jgi:hypothetical protein
MDRRRLVLGLMSLPASGVGAVTVHPFTAARAQLGSESLYGTDETATTMLMPSGPVVSQSDGDIIENLDIDAPSGDGISVSHPRVTVRNCRIRHAGGYGVCATGAPGLVLQQLEIDHAGAPQSGAGPSYHRNNVNIEHCPGTNISRVKASRGSSNIYVEHSEGTRMSFLELHDARGPFPRGQNVQLNASPDSVLEDFSAENGPTSWTEDNVSIFLSDRCAVRRGLVSYNNSPTGDGVMIEGSFDCTVEDIDAVQQGNGAFAAVPLGNAGSGGCVFRRCRTCQSYNTTRDGRPAPTSNGLSIYTLISPGARKHTITDCHFYAIANPGNLVWDTRAVDKGWVFTAQRFTPRAPLRLDLRW